MTVSSQGTSVTFGGAELGKVVGVGGSFATTLKEIRPLGIGVDIDTGQYLSVFEQAMCEQTVEIEAIATAFSIASVGSTATLSVAGTGWEINFGIALMENLKVNAKVGDVLRVSYTFKRSAQ